MACFVAVYETAPVKWPESMRSKFGRKLQNRTALSYDFNGDFEVESYLRYQGTKFVARFDAKEVAERLIALDVVRDNGNELSRLMLRG